MPDAQHPQGTQSGRHPRGKDKKEREGAESEKASHPYTADGHINRCAKKQKDKQKSHLIRWLDLCSKF